VVGEFAERKLSSFLKLERLLSDVHQMSTFEPFAFQYVGLNFENLGHGTGKVVLVRPTGASHMCRL